MKYYENDEFSIPKKYQSMSIEQLDRSCKSWEKFYKFISKQKPSKKSTLDSLGIKVNFD